MGTSEAAAPVLALSCEHAIGGALIDLEAAVASQPHRHRGEVLVVAGDTVAPLVEELLRALLHQREAAVDRRAHSLVAGAGVGPRLTVGYLGGLLDPVGDAGFSQKLDELGMSATTGPGERGLAARVRCLDVDPALDQRSGDGRLAGLEVRRQ